MSLECMTDADGADGCADGAMLMRPALNSAAGSAEGRLWWARDAYVSRTERGWGAAAAGPHLYNRWRVGCCHIPKCAGV